MSKKASIKTGLRRALERRPTTTAAITRPDPDSAAIELGSATLNYTFSPYDDEGDPATEEQHTEIFNDLAAIVAEHNAVL